MLRCVESPRGQTALLGVVFLLVFSAYLVIQTFSSKLYGERLASAMEATLYAVFTLVRGSDRTDMQAGDRRTDRP